MEVVSGEAISGATARQAVATARGRIRLTPRRSILIIILFLLFLPSFTRIGCQAPGPAIGERRSVHFAAPAARCADRPAAAPRASAPRRAAPRSAIAHPALRR